MSTYRGGLNGTVLYGMMGSGKSRLGERLAFHLGVPFTDTDALIEDFTGRTAAQLIAAGEDFPAVQAEAIISFRPVTPEVISTGGSVANYSELVEHLAQFGVGVFIDVSSSVLQQRLSPERIAALNNPDGLSFPDLHARRLGAYRAAAQLVLPVPVEQPIDVTAGQLLELRATA